MSFFGGGHWYPCFGFLVTSPLGFKARVGSALFAIFVEANVMYIPQDSPLVLHLPTSWQPACSRSLLHMHVQRWDLAQIRTCNRTNRRRTRYHCASDPALPEKLYKQHKTTRKSLCYNIIFLSLNKRRFKPHICIPIFLVDPWCSVSYISKYVVEWVCAM